MNQVLYKLCQNHLDIFNGCYPCPVRCIVGSLNISVNQARYQLKKLREKELAKVIYMKAFDDEFPLFYHGWTITEKAKKTKEYRKAW